ncbi:T9SS type A sorting domain-containing protein [Flavobacterium sp.]|uniref:T9SS type A sorting domain-containing protein n=1 Tax=Flavobacterium sp. TaxID=239 RepID=UPI00375336BD
MKNKINLLFIFLIVSFFNFAQTTTLNERVLIVQNTNSPISLAIAEDYSTRRNVTKILTIDCFDSATNSDYEYINFPDYVTIIENPIKEYLSTHPEIDFIVLTKGIPIHIYNTPNKPYGGNCCVDSRISSINYETSPTSSIVSISDIDYGNTFVGQAYANKFWNSTTRFSNSVFGGYLVTRLDGYTQADAIALTTRSLEAENNFTNGIVTSGTILLDACADFGFPNEPQPYSIYPDNYISGQTISITTEGPYGLYNSDMQESSTDLSSANIPVQFDTANTFIGNITNLKGYISWGSNDTNYNANTYNSLGFSVGALGETAVSTGGRTFLPTTGGQSLIANLVSQGITGVKGYTDEPLLVAVASPKIIFNRYRNGWTMAESFYAASRLVGWMDIVIGDPICRAYASNLAISSFDEDALIRIYPNPAEEIIYTSKNENFNYKIVDNNGRLILEGILENQQISVSQLITGIYFITFYNDLKSETKKLIKK